MNLTNRLSSIDLTTLARVKSAISTSVTDTTEDVTIQDLITDVSRRLVEYMQIHASAIERTEIYRTRKFSRIVTLDGLPIDRAATLEVQVGFNDTEFTNVVVEDRGSYAVHSAGGYIEFVDRATTIVRRARLVLAANYTRVKYTGGLGADTAAIIIAFPDIARACDLQVKYLMDRLATIGGNIVTGFGGATEFTDEYLLLKEVRRTLDIYARRPV